jgi:hypothetical protein
LYFVLCIISPFVCNCLLTIFAIVYRQCHQMDTHLQQVKITSFRLPGALLPSWPRWPPVETPSFQSPVYLPNSPVNEPPPRSPTGLLRRCSVSRASGLFIYSYLSESPVKEFCHGTGGKHMITVHGAPGRRKAYIQWGAARFPKWIIYDTAITTPLLCSLQHDTFRWPVIPSTLAWADERPVTQPMS